MLFVLSGKALHLRDVENVSLPPREVKGRVRRHRIERLDSKSFEIGRQSVTSALMGTVASPDQIRVGHSRGRGTRHHVFIIFCKASADRSCPCMLLSEDVTKIMAGINALADEHLR